MEYIDKESEEGSRNRFWRKNRLLTQCTQINIGFYHPSNTQCCQRVDLNKNFDWFFGQLFSSINVSIHYVHIHKISVAVWTAQALQSTYGPKCTVGTGADTILSGIR
uniref:Uncharacterized protein n=1 Tax=Meloidogyne incognita TaxID=6306 RepID=A0A914KYP9_MELIC